MTLSYVRKICSPTFTGDPARPYNYPTVFRTWFWRIDWNESSAAPPSIFRMETFLSIRHSRPVRGPHDVGPSVEGDPGRYGDVTVGEGNVTVFEDLADGGRGVDDDAGHGAEAELEDWAIGVGQAGEVGVELWVEREKVTEYGHAQWAWGQRWDFVAGLFHAHPCTPDACENG
ncbi:hypothetical protein GBA52_015761 [Prunus armeniaca]|nr:hypothetical protein GBA52_015761 [Prunus armeniaca]